MPTPRGLSSKAEIQAEEKRPCQLASMLTEFDNFSRGIYPLLSVAPCLVSLNDLGLYCPVWTTVKPPIRHAYPYLGHVINMELANVFACCTSPADLKLN